MRYGFVLPGGTAPQQLELAEIADRSGWDGVFVWEAAYGVDALDAAGGDGAADGAGAAGDDADPAAVAAAVEGGEPGRHPRSGFRWPRHPGGWAGAVETELGNTGEETDRRARADMLDEGIDLIRSFWEGRLRYEGRRYRRRTSSGGMIWPRLRSRSRSASRSGLSRRGQDRSRCSGCCAATGSCRMSWTARASGRPRRMTSAPCESGSMSMAPQRLRSRGEGETPADDPDEARRRVALWEDAGATWWLEARSAMPHHSAERMQQVRERLEAGPPRPTTS